MALQTAKTEDPHAELRARLDNSQLEVRLARSDAELAAAQALRYRIFYDEMGAQPTPEMRSTGRDYDKFDGLCDHLLAFDWSKPGDAPVVGTYRLLREDVARRHGGFYSASEFDLSVLERNRRPDDNFLELGRSCVDVEYRTNSVINHLWRAISGYILEHRISLMFGCASLPGVDPDQLALPLSYLYHRHLASPERRVRALPNRHVEMNRMAEDAFVARAGLRSLPPLLKGYLRLGGFIGDGAVIDPEFQTTDCFIMVPCNAITNRYVAHYQGERSDS